MIVERAVIVGASGGIGATLAAALAGRGTRVHALTRSGKAALSGIVEGTIDITDEATIAAAAARIGVEGPVDLIIVATGLLHGDGVAPEKSVRDLSADTMATYFAVNATGPGLVAKHFAPLLARDRRSTFAALSARVGSIGDNRLGGWYGYRASKAALNMLVRTLSIEVARTRPQAVCAALHPGTVDTALSKPFQRGVQTEKLFTPEFAAERLLDVIAKLTPADSGHCFAWDGMPIAP
jgi:NAD(P)-dependent dehydrogenase (short-subunit alcohol dehydrogenase family)